MIKRKERFIINWLGGTLPKESVNSADFYKFFVIFNIPWRKLQDLKSETESWEQAFMRHKVMDIAYDMYKNWTILNQCYSARDDLNAKRNRSDHASWFATPANSADLANIDERGHNGVNDGVIEQFAINVEEQTYNPDVKDSRVSPVVNQLELCNWRTTRDITLPQLPQINVQPNMTPDFWSKIYSLHRVEAKTLPGYKAAVARIRERPLENTCKIKTPLTDAQSSTSLHPKTMRIVNEIIKKRKLYPDQ
ncbi:hypothetical protein HDU76_011016, partial [Blyttiomyces sp. JEL0837]